eukprot:3606994-Amphidinium_carterae.2
MAAQQLINQRPANDGLATAATAFLHNLNVERILALALLGAAVSSIMRLIRELYTEHHDVAKKGCVCLE